MKVILTKDVQGLGRAGDVKEVSDGYARNFLLQKRLGLPATNELLNKLQKETAEHQAKIAKENERFTQQKNKLHNKVFTIKAKANGKNLFAAIHEKEIAKAITEKFGVEIEPAAVVLKKPVKSLGEHDIQIRFASNVLALVKLNVETINSNGKE